MTHLKISRVILLTSTIPQSMTKKGKSDLPFDQPRLYRALKVAVNGSHPTGLVRLLQLARLCARHISEPTSTL
jgi:hypothetical protein